MKTVELLLYLDILAYFPELSRNGYKTIEEFIDDHLSAENDKRPKTMFNGYKSDEKTGIVSLVKMLSKNERVRNLTICCDSSETNKYNAFCLTEDKIIGDRIVKRNIYVILGANYREGEYFSDGGITCTWSDNFLGAVQTDTAEQKNILNFYDNAVGKSSEDLPSDAEISIIVSGHSKGGNLAQYITVMRDNVTKCYSFDGQGFSEKFIKKYELEIQKNGSKINCIYPDMSAVGSLLYPIPNAKKCYICTCYRNTLKLPFYYHIPTQLLDGNYRLRPFAKGFVPLSESLNKISISAVRIAQKIPFINTEKGLSELGRAIMFLFKNRNEEFVHSLMNRNAVSLIVVGLIISLFIIPVYAAAVSMLKFEKVVVKK